MAGGEPFHDPPSSALGIHILSQGHQLGKLSNQTLPSYDQPRARRQSPFIHHLLLESDALLDVHIHVGGVHPARALQLSLNLPCMNTTHPGLQLTQHSSTQTLPSSKGQTQAHCPDGAFVGWVMATLPMPNSVREEGLGYGSQTPDAGYPFSSAESKDQVVGVWDRAKGLGQHEEDDQICKSATTTTASTSGSLTHLHS